jgi:hypothetical protein
MCFLLQIANRWKDAKFLRRFVNNESDEETPWNWVKVEQPPWLGSSRPEELGRERHRCCALLWVFWWQCWCMHEVGIGHAEHTPARVISNLRVHTSYKCKWIFLWNMAHFPTDIFTGKRPTFWWAHEQLTEKIALLIFLRRCAIESV